MAQQANDVLLRIQVDGEKALQAVREYTDKVDALKRTQNQLKKALQEVEKERQDAIKSYEEGKMTVEEYRKTIDAVDESENNVKNRLTEVSAELGNTTQTLRGYQKELQNVYKQQEALATDSEGSLVALRAELSNATKAFDNLSRAEREGAKGAELLDHINELTDEIKGAEEATQRYQRNVGNYKSALEGAEIAVTGLQEGLAGFVSGGNTFITQIITMGVESGNLSQALAGAKVAVIAFGNSLKALISNPIVAVIAAIASVFLAVKDAIGRSEEASDSLAAGWAALKTSFRFVFENFTQLGWIIQGVTWAITKLGEVMNVLIGQMNQVAQSIKDFPVIGEMMSKQLQQMADAVSVEKDRLALHKQERAQMIELQKMENESQELRAKIAEKDKYTAKERMDMVEQVIKVETDMANKRKETAAERLRIIEAEIAAGNKSTAKLDERAEAERELLKIEGELSAKIRELLGLRVETKATIEAEAKAIRDAAKARAEAAAQVAKEMADKEREAIREAENIFIQLIQNNYEQRRKQSEVEHKRDVEDLERRLAEEKNLTVEARIAIQKQIFLLKEKHRQDMAQIDKEEAENNEKMLKEEEEARKEASAKKYQEEIEQRALALDTELELIRAKNMAEIEEQQAMLEAKIEAKREEIQAMQQLEGESNEEFYLRQLQANNDLAELNKQYADNTTRITQEEAKKKREAYNSVMQAMTAMGEHSKALGKVAKIMGLAQIAVDTGKAISAGVASASVLPFPANLTAIATTVATVLTNMATALTTIKSAKFATGGLVTGAGSGTSDSIPAMLSNGESVMTAQATSAFAPLLSSLNQMGGGVPIQATSIGSQQMGEDMLARAVARGVAELQPVVSVEEINRVSGNVKVIESLATL